MGNLSGSSASTARQARGLRAVVAWLMAVALCVGLLPVLPAGAQQAYADETEGTAAESTVTLTIVAGTQTDWDTYETSYITWLNKEYSFAPGDTLEDLLGYAAEDGISVDVSGGYLNSVTSKGDGTLSGYTTSDGTTTLYWSLYENGSYASTGVTDTVLVSGNSYQLAWTCYSSVPTEYGSDMWKAYYDENEPTAIESGEDGEGSTSGDEGAAEETGQDIATLTIVAGTQTDWDTYETSYITWLNKEYSFASGATLEDLLGYAAEDGISVDVSDGYLNSVAAKDKGTLAGWNAPDYSVSLYWSLYKDGEYLPTGVSKTVLEAGHSYQLAWTCYSSVPTEYGCDMWTAYYQENEPGESTNTPISTPVERPASEYAAGVSTDQYISVAKAIVDSYAGTSDPWEVLALSALNMQDAADLDALLAEGVEQIKNPTEATSMQRYIIALTAAGYDAKALPVADGTFDAIGQLASVTVNSPLNVRVATLWAYASGNYKPSESALSIEALINSVIASAHEDGGYSYTGSVSDADMTAMAICALTAYQDEYPQIANAINAALNALKDLQLEDGSFPDNKGVSNACSTAYAIIALCAAGIDPATEWATATGATPLSGLLGFAASDYPGFLRNGEIDGMSTYQGLMALASYQGLLNAKAAGQDSYNLYAQARFHTANLPGAPAGAAGDSQNGGLAKTGDDSVAVTVAGVMALVAFAAVATSAVALRRRASSEGAANRSEQ